MSHEAQSSLGAGQFTKRMKINIMTDIIECPICKIKHRHSFPSHLRSNTFTIDIGKYSNFDFELTK